MAAYIGAQTSLSEKNCHMGSVIHEFQLLIFKVNSWSSLWISVQIIFKEIATSLPFLAMTCVHYNVFSLSSPGKSTTTSSSDGISFWRASHSMSFSSLIPSCVKDEMNT